MTFRSDLSSVERSRLHRLAGGPIGDWTTDRRDVVDSLVSRGLARITTDVPARALWSAVITPDGRELHMQLFTTGGLSADEKQGRHRSCVCRKCGP